MVNDLGHWVTEAELPSDVPFGFIYIIINNITDRRYIGKKQCLTKFRKPLKKNQKKRESVIKQTDWRTYTSSSDVLNKDITAYGKENFTFKIIRFCSSKWELGYYEIREQIINDVMFKKEYYNGIINCRLCKLKEYR